MDQLFPYQNEGASFLADKRLAMLADEMGLGKSVQAIRGLDSVHAHNVLIVCPSIARINWLREFEKWALLKRRYTVLTGLRDPVPRSGAAICSFEYATENMISLKRFKWDAVVLDEAHYLKSHETKRSKAVLGKDGLIHSASRTWFLTGTPAPNDPSELWVFLRVAGQTKLTYEQFVERYCKVTKTSYGLKIHGANGHRIPELRQLLSTIMLRRLKKDVMTQLPPLFYSKLNVEPGLVDLEIQSAFTEYFHPIERRKDLFDELNAQKKLLQDVVDNSVGVEGRLLAIKSIATSVSSLRKYNGLQKVDPAIEYVHWQFKQKSFSKLVIFCVHRDVIEGLRIGLKKYRPQIVYGGTPPGKRQTRIDRFQKEPTAKVFIGNIRAAGIAVNLTSAHDVLFVEQDWVPGNNAQAVMRCHRIGQKNSVNVRTMVIDGTLDAQIDFILARKTKDLTEIFD